MNTILFDLDGTLIDSSEGIIKCVLYTLDFYELRSRIRQNYTGLSGRRFRRVLKDIMDFRMKKRRGCAEIPGTVQYDGNF